MKTALLRIGRGRTAWADEASGDYGRRLRGKLDIDELLIKPTPFRGDIAAVQADEAERLVGRMKDGDRLVALDERGEQITTEELARWIDEAARASTSRLVFAIGGPYGHGPAVKQRAWRTLALSRMVLNHELARVLLVEQLYRASTILWGGSYHH